MSAVVEAALRAAGLQVTADAQQAALRAAGLPPAGPEPRPELVTSGAPGWIVTPQTMLDYLREVDGLYDSTHAAVMAQAGPAAPAGPAGPNGPTGSAPITLLAAWAAKLAAWKLFFKEHEGFMDRLTGAVADTTERFEKDALEFRASFEKAGISMAGAPYAPSREPGGPSLPSLSDVSSTLMWGAVGLGAVFLLFRSGSAR